MGWNWRTGIWYAACERWARRPRQWNIYRKTLETAENALKASPTDMDSLTEALFVEDDMADPMASSRNHAGAVE